VPFRMTMNDL